MQELARSVRLAVPLQRIDFKAVSLRRVEDPLLRFRQAMPNEENNVSEISKINTSIVDTNDDTMNLIIRTRLTEVRLWKSILCHGSA